MCRKHLLCPVSYVMISDIINSMTIWITSQFHSYVSSQLHLHRPAVREHRQGFLSTSLQFIIITILKSARKKNTKSEHAYACSWRLILRFHGCNLQCFFKGKKFLASCRNLAVSSWQSVGTSLKRRR